MRTLMLGKNHHFRVASYTQEIMIDESLEAHHGLLNHLTLCGDCTDEKGVCPIGQMFMEDAEHHKSLLRRVGV